MNSVAPERQERWVHLFSKPWHERTEADLQELDSTCASLVAALAPMPAPVRQDMLRHGRLVYVAPGQTLFRQGEPGDAVYIVLGGWARVRVVADSGVAIGSIDPSDMKKRDGPSHLSFSDPNVVNTVGPLELLGERALHQLLIDLLLRGGERSGASPPQLVRVQAASDARPQRAAPVPATAFARTQAALAGDNFLHANPVSGPQVLARRGSEAALHARLLAKGVGFRPPRVQLVAALGDDAPVDVTEALGGGHGEASAAAAPEEAGGVLARSASLWGASLGVVGLTGIDEADAESSSSSGGSNSSNEGAASHGGSARRGRGASKAHKRGGGSMSSLPAPLGSFDGAAASQAGSFTSRTAYSEAAPATLSMEEVPPHASAPPQLQRQLDRRMSSPSASSLHDAPRRRAVAARVDDFVALLRRIIALDGVTGTEAAHVGDGSGIDWRGMGWRARADTLPDRGVVPGAGPGELGERGGSSSTEDEAVQELVARTLYGDAAVDALAGGRGAAKHGAAPRPALCIAGGVRMATILAPRDVACVALRIPAAAYLCALARARGHMQRSALKVLHLVEPFVRWPADALAKIAATAQRRVYRLGEVLAAQVRVCVWGGAAEERARPSLGR